MITQAKLDGRVEVSITDGRIEVTDDGSGSLYVKEVEHTPLSEDEPQATLIISSANGTAEITISATAVDGLADAIYRIQETND